MTSKNKILFFISKEIKDLNNYNLLQSCVFFIKNTFHKYLNLFDQINIEICTQKEYTADSEGCFVVVKNNLYCLVNIDQTKAKIENNTSFKTLEKSLFFTILHELGHAYYMLKSFNKSNSKLNIEEYYDEGDRNIGNQIKDIKEKDPDLSEIEVSRLIKEEIFADNFALKNLSYFENLYEYEGILI